MNLDALDNRPGFNRFVNSKKAMLTLTPQKSREYYIALGKVNRITIEYITCDQIPN